MQAQTLEQELGIAMDRHMLNRLKKKLPNGPLLEEDEKAQHQSSLHQPEKSPTKFAERLPRYFWSGS